MIVRLLFAFCSLLAVLGLGGCGKGTLLVGAWVCQGVGRPECSEQAYPWAFKGLDPETAPRIRPGSYASVTHGVHFIDPNALGPHGYWLNWQEKNGIVYTCRAGHIDIAHVRKAADWTGYLAARTLETLAEGRDEFEFKLREPSLYRVQITYPDNWESLSPDQRVHVARDVSCCLGQYLGYTAMTWHEILTWFGFRPKGYKSEFPSAFSWEDTYSNLLGTQIAIQALEAEDQNFSEAVTFILDEELGRREVRSAQEALETTEALRGKWFDKAGLFTLILRRHLDLGLRDGYVRPCLAADSLSCQCREPVPLAVPSLECLAEHGFTVHLEIEPRVWENRKIFRAVHPGESIASGQIDPAVHFPQIMDFIAAEAVDRYGHDIGSNGRPTARLSDSGGGT